MEKIEHGKRIVGTIRELSEAYMSIKQEIVNQFPEDKRDEINDKIKTIYAITTRATMQKIEETINPNNFSIDFFELMFLAESVIPPKPIARSVCFDDFSEKHYRKMSKEQRLQFFNQVIKQDGFKLENEKCKNFYARFNPDNQYLVFCKYANEKITQECYLMDGKYMTGKYTSIVEECILKIEKL